MELAKLIIIDLLNEHRLTNYAEHNASRRVHLARSWIVQKGYTSH